MEKWLPAIFPTEEDFFADKLNILKLVASDEEINDYGMDPSVLGEEVKVHGIVLGFYGNEIKVSNAKTDISDKKFNLDKPNEIT